MCRNIRTLHNFEPPATEDEIQASALQYVRKISGSTKPSQANAEAFELAVERIAEVTRELLDSLVTTAPPKDREVEAAKARERAQKRYAARPSYGRGRVSRATRSSSTSRGAARFAGCLPGTASLSSAIAASRSAASASRSGSAS